MARFADRRFAGTLLGQSLAALRLESPIVLGIARGGVVVAAEVARSLGAPLDVLLVKKIGVPDDEEVAMGAIAEDGTLVHDPSVRVRALVPDAAFVGAARAAAGALARRRALYRGAVPRLPLSGRTVVIVDDGVATGATALAAIASARRAGASRIVFAAPVSIGRSDEYLEGEADDLAILRRAPLLAGVADAYDHFDPVGDEEVLSFFAAAPEGAREKGGVS